MAAGVDVVGQQLDVVELGAGRLVVVLVGVDPGPRRDAVHHAEGVEVGTEALLRSSTRSGAASNVTSAPQFSTVTG